MANIKVRIWDKAESKWMFGYESLGGFSLFGETVLLGEFAHEISLDKLSNGDYVVEQYTGLKDKNGVEIYEGDIVRDDQGWRGYLEFRANGNVAEYLITSDGDDGWYAWDSEPIEVIGNIHTNPELLKG